MTSIPIEDAQRDLRNILQRVEAGESFVIVDGDHPAAQIGPVERRPQSLRPYGLCAGEFNVPDDFDAPLPKDVLRSFEEQ